jgi:hypothetical protein
MRNKIFTIVLLAASLSLHAKERVELVPFGNFESWTVRYIKESALIGGKTKTLYMIGPTDTIRSKKPFIPSDKTPWGSSNAHARALGIEKVSLSVRPEKRGDGWCCRMENVLEIVTAIGIDLKALAAGSIYTGRLLDPVGLKQGSDPISGIDMGVPFKGRPKALMLDFKAYIQPTGQVVFADAGTRVKKVPGHDEGQITVLLQHRWEKDGHIYSYRVGTAHERISRTTSSWVNDHRVPIHYAPFGAITDHPIKAKNSKGAMVDVEELDFRSELEPTHIVILVGAGSMKAFTGCPGNIVWCDNIRLVYEE